MNKRTSPPLGLLLCAILAAASLWAQYDTAEVLGAVHDPASAAIPRLAEPH